jgi:hypothetical protein
MPAFMPVPGFIGPSYAAQSPRVDTERCVNWMPETKDAGTPSAQTWYYATPGLLTTQTIGAGPHRAALQMDGEAYVVSGTRFDKVTATVTTNIGTVADDGLPASMATNGPGGFQVFIVSGGKGYIYNTSSGAFAQIADVDFPTNVGMCAFLDGYFLVSQKNTAKFYISALEDGTDWDPLDVAQKSQTADYILSLFVDLDRKTVWLLGSQDTEVWWDSGAALFPFEPVPNALMSMGVVGPFAFVQPDDATIWIGESSNGSRHAYEATGLKPNKISTHAVEFAWSQYASIDDVYGWTCEYRGHSLCVFQFPSADATWVYDRTEQGWFEWLSWDTTYGVFHAHKASTHFYAFNTHYVGSRQDGTLYALSSDYLSDDGATVRRVRRFPHLESADCLIFCSEIRFGFQVGVGLASGQGSDPQVMFRISRDGGRTWDAERWTSLGALGDYLRRVRFLRNGKWRDGVWELAVSDPVVLALVDCTASLSKAAS